MTLKIACTLGLLGALSAPALAQQPSAAPKPTKAEVQKVVQIISADKAKTATYCKLAAINEEMAKANETKDGNKFQELGKQFEALGKTLGPEYVRLTDGLEQVDPQSKEGDELLSEFDALDKLCAKP